MRTYLIAGAILAAVSGLVYLHIHSLEERLTAAHAESAALRAANDGNLATINALAEEIKRRDQVNVERAAAYRAIESDLQHAKEEKRRALEQLTGTDRYCAADWRIPDQWLRPPGTHRADADGEAVP